MDKPNLFYYWEGPMPAFIGLCLETIEGHCKDSFNMHRLDDKKASELLDLPKEYYDIKSYNHKTDYLKARLVYEYGGFWVDADTIVLEDFIKWNDLLDEHDFIGIPGFFGANKGCKIMKDWVEPIEKLIREKSEFHWAELIDPLIRGGVWKEFEILTKEMISPFYYMGEEANYFFHKDKNINDYLTNETKVCILFNALFPQYFKQMSKEEVLNSGMLIADLYKLSFDNMRNENKPVEFQRPEKKLLSVICSFNTKRLTERLYKELLANEGHDIVVLENSSEEDKRFMCPHTLDLGRENLGFGGMREKIFLNPEYKKYDFIGIFNNDVYGIGKDYIKKMKKYLTEDTGIAVNALNPEGTGWQHMRKKGNYRRMTQHAEDAVGWFNNKLTPEFIKYFPTDYFGITDIHFSQISLMNGYKNYILDDVPVMHMLSGARKEAGVEEIYHREYGGKLEEWNRRCPDLGKRYSNYLDRYNGISIVITHYNDQEKLAKAVHSATLQANVPREIIVVDDHSHGDPYQSIKNINPRTDTGNREIKYIRHDKNLGTSAARNTGIRESYYEWVFILDGDDEMVDGILQKLYDNRTHDIVYGKVVYHNTGIPLEPHKEVLRERFFETNQMSGCILFHKDVWRNIGGYWEEHNCHEDWDFVGRASMLGYEFKYIDEATIRYNSQPTGRCHLLSADPENKVSTINHIREYDNHIQQLRRDL